MMAPGTVTDRPSGHLRSLLALIAVALLTLGAAGHLSYSGAPQPLLSGPGTRYSLGTFKDTGVTLSDFTHATERFRMPIGDDGTEDLGEELGLLKIEDWPDAGYPRISFNEESGENGWYVATAFNQDRWLNNGWAEPSPDTKSVYRGGNFHPGEDWNGLDGNDLGKPVRVVGDGIVLLSQEQLCADDRTGDWQPCVFGNLVVVGHLTPAGQVMGSVYAHLQRPSPLAAGERLRRGDVVGRLGRSATATPHLHFEMTRPDGELIRIDPHGNVQVPVLETGAMRIGWHWPINDPLYVSRHYLNPSRFLLEQGKDSAGRSTE
jgi:murein DD-endopeptidase MepM/ murein hydrolase activator NlpD